METFVQDLRYGLRALLKNKGFTAIAIIVLALGIGANTAIFSVVNSILLRPLPFTDPERLVQLSESRVKRGAAQMPASYPNFADWRDQNSLLENLVAYSDWNFNLTGLGEPERIQSALVSPAFFTTLGIKPIVGRVFSSDEDQAGKDLVVVIGRRLWQRRFNSDPGIVGQTLNLNDRVFTVIGVIPEGAQRPVESDEIELWAPLSHGSGLKNRYAHYLSVLGRLKVGATLQQANAEMTTIASRLQQQYPDSNVDAGVRLVPLHEQLVGDYKASLYLLLGAVAFVLLIAAANIANMLLARASSRKKEIAIRTALGASRTRIVRQLLTESMLLSLIGGTLGLLIAMWGVELLLTLGPSGLPRTNEVVVDARVLGFTLGVSLLTGMFFGLIPALQSSRPDCNETLKEGGRRASGGRQRARNLLVVSEIALSLILLVGAGLLIRSFLRLQSVSPGFNSRNVLTMRLDLSGQKSKSGKQAIAFQSQLIERIKALPGVQSAATRSFVPITSDWAYLSFAVEGHPIDRANRSVAYYNGVSPEYFQTMQIPLTNGREFNQQDVKGTQNVAIINTTLAHRYFSNENPIGKRITLDDADFSADSWTTIVGIVGDTKPKSLDGDPAAEMYMPFAQQPEPSMSLMVRCANDPASVAAAIRAEVLALDKDQPVYSIKTLDSLLSASVATPRFRTLLLGLFATLALILATVGIYGVMSYSVIQGTHEIGIRMALGANVTDVLLLILKNGMRLALAGVAIGLVGAFALTRLMSTLLFGVEPTDGMTFTIVSAGLIGIAMFACYVPARRAAKVDPLVALRYE
jgi:putative ABC transport system permease protein